MKKFEEVKIQSTCKKKITICEIYSEDGILLSRESNRCNPENGICSRINIIQDKKNYDKESNCNWTHAEINSINNLPKNSRPFISLLYGHSFYCNECENKLKKIGVKFLLISEISL